MIYGLIFFIDNKFCTETGALSVIGHDVTKEQKLKNEKALQYKKELERQIEQSRLQKQARKSPRSPIRMLLFCECFVIYFVMIIQYIVYLNR